MKQAFDETEPEAELDAELEPGAGAGAAIPTASAAAAAAEAAVGDAVYGRKFNAIIPKIQARRQSPRREEELGDVQWSGVRARSAITEEREREREEREIEEGEGFGES